MSVGGQIVLQPNQSLPSWQKLTTDTDIRTLTTLISPLTTTRERFTKKNYRESKKSGKFRPF